MQPPQQVTTTTGSHLALAGRSAVCRTKAGSIGLGDRPAGLGLILLFISSLLALGAWLFWTVPDLRHGFVDMRANPQFGRCLHARERSVGLCSK